MKRTLITICCAAAAILGLALASPVAAVTVSYSVGGAGPTLYPGPVTPPAGSPWGPTGYPGDMVEFQTYTSTLDLVPGTFVKQIGTLLWSIDYTYAGTATCWDYPACWTAPLLHIVSALRSMSVGTASGALAQSGSTLR